MRKRWTALALTLVMAVSILLPARGAEAASAGEGQSALEDAAYLAASAALTYGSAESIQYALWQDGAVRLTGNAGTYSRMENRALTDDILYGVGSVSKIYTTVAVLQLAERGKLSLDAPVTRYLPSFRMADQRYKKITVRMLLNHSSGLMGSSMENALLFDDPDRTAAETLLNRLASQALKADPGAYSVYCNDGFTLAELVVEAVSGKSFPDYVREKILKPAKLSQTFCPGERFDKSLLAKTYLGADFRPLPAETLGTVGAGGIYASASDLAAFGGALTSTALLKKSSLAAMAAPEYRRGVWPEGMPGLLSFGLGWDAVEFFPFSQNDITALVKGGDTLRYHAGLIVLPEYRMAAAVVSSGGSSLYNEMAACRMLAAALKERGVTLDETLPALPETSPAAMPASMLSIAGYYGSSIAQYQVSLTPEGVLTLHCLTNPVLVPDQTLVYAADGTFREPTGTAYLRFVRESNGKTYLYQRSAAALPGLGGLPISEYTAVKLEDNPVSPEVQARWDTVLRTPILPMTEKYTSQVYASLAETQGTENVETAPGYVGGSRIAGMDQLRYDLQVPGNGGRDGQEMRLEDRGGVLWINSGGAWYMEESGAPGLYTGSGSSYTTVQDDGYARWYHTGSAAGKTMTVRLPETAGFWVYDANGQVAASSVLWGDRSVLLPKDGLVVFAGDPGDRFHLTFQ